MSLLDNTNYQITASSYHPLFPPSNLVDSCANTFWMPNWTTNNNRYLGNGKYTGVISTQVVNVGNVSGEWFQIKLPSSAIVSTYGLKSYNSILSRYPKSFYLVGSTDESAWNVIDYKTNQIITDFNTVNYSVSSSSLYKYYRLIIVELDTNAEATDPNISSFLLNIATGASISLNSFSTNSTAISISTWIKTTSTNSIILDFADASLNKNNIKLQTDVSGYLSIYVEKDGQSNTTVLSNNTIANDVWHHIVVNIENTVNGATYTSFIDNVQHIVSTEKLYPNDVLRTSNLLLGSNIEGETAITGNMDDMRVYSRLLTLSEVSELYEYTNQYVFPLNTDANLLVYESMDTTNVSQFTISGLTNGTQYNVKMRSINYAPTSNTSSLSNDISGVPYTLPSTPVITALPALNGIDVSFTQTSTGGYPIVKYTYSFDETTYIDASGTTSPLQIRGLNIGESYSVRIKAFTSAPENNESGISNVSTTIPYDIPAQPTIQIADSYDKTVKLVISRPYTGGYSLQKYQYSTDGTNYTDAILGEPACDDSTLAPYVAGSWISGGYIKAVIRYLTNGKRVYLCNDAGTIKMVTFDGEKKNYSGTFDNFNANNWNTYTSVSDSTSYLARFFLQVTYKNDAYLDENTKVHGKSSLRLTDTSSSFVTLPNTVTPTTGLTYAFWIKTGMTGNSTNVRIYEAGGPSTTSGCQIIHMNSSGNLSIQLVNDASNQIYMIAPTINTDEWKHVAVTVDPSGILKSYVNGALTTNITNAIYPKSGITLGNGLLGKSVANQDYFNGYLDDFRYYGRLLSYHEILQIYGYQGQNNFYLNYDNSVLIYLNFNSDSGAVGYIKGITNGTTFNQNQDNDVNLITPSGDVVFVRGLTNGVSNTIYVRASTAVTNGYSSTITKTSYAVPSAPTLTSTLSDRTARLNYSFTGSTGGYSFVKFLYTVNDSSLVDVTDVSYTLFTDLSYGETYTYKYYTLTDAPDNNISYSSTRSILPYKAPDAPVITAFDVSNQNINISFTQGFNGGYPISNYQYQLDNSGAWTSFGSTSSPLSINGLTNGTSYIVTIRAISSAPDTNISLASNSITALPYTNPSVPIIRNVDSSSNTLDVYYDISTNGGYAIDYYEISVDSGSYINIGTQLPYTIDATSYTAGTVHTIIMRAISTAPLNNVSISSAQYNAYYVGTTTIPTPVITSADISNGTMNVYYTQGLHDIPTQKFICTEDETTYSEITELNVTGTIMNNPLDIDPSLIFYYTFDTDSVNGLNLANKASGTYVYDASLSATGLISSANKKYGTACLELSSPLKWAVLPPFNIGANGFTVSVWFRNNNSDVYSRVFDFATAINAGGNNFMSLFNYFGNSYAMGYDNARILGPNVNINDNVWKHYVMTCSPTGYYKFYLNNIILEQKQATYPVARQYNSNFIGKSNFSGDNLPINGGIDEFRLYTRELTTDEVSKLYAYSPLIDTTITKLQYDLTSPLKIDNLLNGRPYSFKIRSVLDTSVNVQTINNSFSSGTTGWTLESSGGSISTPTISSVQPNVGINASNALLVQQSAIETTTLTQNVNVYGAGTYLLKVNATGGSGYDSSAQRLQLGINGNYSVPFKLTSTWRNYVHLFNIPDAISTKQIQLKVVNSVANSANELDYSSMYIESMPIFTYSSNVSTGIAISDDENTAVQCVNGGRLSFAKRINGVWGGFNATSDPTTRNYRGVALTGDGSRLVFVAGSAFFSPWTGTNYGNFVRTDDPASRSYNGCALSKDGSRFIASVSNGFIYFATWHGSNYGLFTQTLDVARAYGAITCSRNADRIVYGIDTVSGGFTYFAAWNGTNYDAGTQILDNTLLEARSYALSNDSKYLFSTCAANSTATFRYSVWNGTNYGPYTISSVVPPSLDGWALAINYTNDAFYFAPYGSTNRKIAVPKTININQTTAFGQLLSAKKPWGIFSAEDYNATTQRIQDLRGYLKYAVISGSGVGFSNAIGNGSTVSIPQITGTPSTVITFPSDSIPSTFTICGITRYNGGTRQRILVGTGNWMLGHHASNKNRAYFEGWVASGTLTSPNTNIDDWHVICGKNSGSTPNNVLADGVPIGTGTGGSGNKTLSINTYGENSNFAFSHVFIWDQALTDSEMQLVSQQLTNYLQTGISFKSYFSSGTSLGVTNVSLSKAYVSPLSNVTDSIIPYTSPLPPTINTVDGSNQTLTVSYTDSANNGGYPITKYQYTINGGSTYVDVSAGTNTFIISNLTNGTNYTVTMLSISSAPTNNVSINSTSIIGIPYERASALTITSIDPSNNKLTVNFNTANTGGYSLIRYEYALNAGSYTSASGQLSSPLTITGLTNGTPYSVKIRQVTGAPINPASPDSNIMSSIPFKEPLSPLIVSIDPSNQSLLLNYNNTVDNGGYSVDKYQYTIDGGSNYVDVSAGTNTITIGTLTNGTSYTVRMRTISTAPFKNISLDSSGVIRIPYTRPSAPSINTIDASNAKLYVNFTQGYDGGYPIIRYEYSLNSGAYISASGQLTTPILISGLTNSTTYSVKIRQVTSAPTISSSLDSNILSEIPYTMPNAPVINSIIPSNRTLTVNYTDPSANGRPITSYKYSLNGSATLYDISTAKPMIINTGLSNATEYTVRIYAVNLAGNSNASNAVASTPFSVPTPPQITNIVPGDRTVTLTFTSPVDNGGYVVQGYKYSINGSDPYTNFTPITPNELILNNLLNGTTYTVFIKAYNSKGDSSGSNSAIFTPNANPATPIINNITPTYEGATIYYSNGIGSALITGYKYSVNGGEFVDASYNSTTITVRELINRRLYYVKIRAYNPIFDSSDSNILPVYAGAPIKPVIVDVSAIGTNAYIHYTQELNDSDPIDLYEVFTSGTRIWSQLASTSPIVVPNMISGRLYNIQIRAINQYGASYYSNMIQNVRFGLPPVKIQKILVIPSYSLVTVRVVSVDNKNFPITAYKYSLNDASLSNAGSSPVFNVSGLLKDTSYNIRVVATNEIGDSIPSDPVYFMLTYSQIPEKPEIKRLSMPDKNTLNISLIPPVSATPILKYKYALFRNGVLDLSYTETNNAQLPIVIGGLLPNTNYSAKIIAVNDAGDSPVSNTFPTSVSFTYLPPSQPVLIGTRNINGQMYAIVKIPEMKGATLTNIKYTYNNGVTYTNANSISSPILLANVPLNTRVTLRIVLVTNAGDSPPSKAVTFTRIYRVPSTPFIRAVTPAKNSVSVRISASQPNGSPITGYKYSINGGSYVNITNMVSSVFVISGLTANTNYNVSVISTNAVGDSTAGITKFKTLP